MTIRTFSSPVVSSIYTLFTRAPFISLFSFDTHHSPQHFYSLYMLASKMILPNDSEPLTPPSSPRTDTNTNLASTSSQEEGNPEVTLNAMLNDGALSLPIAMSFLTWPIML